MNILLKDIKALLNENQILQIRKCDIYIKDRKICSIDREPEDYKIDKTIDGTDKFVIPGLINCHTHAYMSIFKNFADDIDFNTWLFERIMPNEDKMNSEDAYYSNLLGMIEMIKSGTTTFVDMHMFKNMSVKAAEKLGMRAVISRGLSGDDRNDEGAIRRLNEACEEIDNNTSDKITFMIAPHAIYTCGDDYLKQCIEVAKKRKLSLNIHLSETENEIEECINKHGITPVEYLNEMGFFDVNTLAAHCVHVNDNDIDILKNKNVNVIANPCSNMKLGNGFAPITKMMNKGINICLGTDSTASNNSLNMFKEMQMISLINKGYDKNPTSVNAKEAINMCTINAAKAIGLSDKIGMIKSDMMADLVILDLNNSQSQPENNLLSALTYSMNGSEVETVIIDGQIVLENKKICFIDEMEIYKKANDIMKKFL